MSLIVWFADMATVGGGWTLIASYKAGQFTNPFKMFEKQVWISRT